MEIRFKETDWASDEIAIRHIRQRVYIEEQNIAAHEEWDLHNESTARYILALHGDKAVGCVRLLPNGYFGRLAVLREHRGDGLGAQLVKAVIQLATAIGHSSLEASAQCYALGFYRALGFSPEGEFFDDAGIPHIHIRMELPVQSPTSQSSHLLFSEDKQTHKLNENIEVHGFLITMLYQRIGKLRIALADPQNPLWHNRKLIDAMVYAAKRLRTSPVELVLQHDKEISELPLIALTRRLDSYFNVKITEQVDASFWMFGQHGIMADASIKPGVDAIYSGSPCDPQTVEKQLKQFQQWHSTGHRGESMRRLFL